MHLFSHMERVFYLSFIWVEYKIHSILTEVSMNAAFELHFIFVKLWDIWNDEIYARIYTLEYRFEMEIDVGGRGGGRSPRPTRRAGAGVTSPVPEVELYVHLLVLVYLVDQKRWNYAEKVGFILFFLFISLVLSYSQIRREATRCYRLLSPARY